MNFDENIKKYINDAERKLTDQIHDADIYMDNSVSRRNKHYLAEAFALFLESILLLICTAAAIFLSYSYIEYKIVYYVCAAALTVLPVIIFIKYTYLLILSSRLKAVMKKMERIKKRLNTTVYNFNTEYTKIVDAGLENFSYDIKTGKSCYPKIKKYGMQITKVSRKGNNSISRRLNILRFIYPAAATVLSAFIMYRLPAYLMYKINGDVLSLTKERIFFYTALALSCAAVIFITYIIFLRFYDNVLISAVLSALSGIAAYLLIVVLAALICSLFAFIGREFYNLWNNYGDFLIEGIYLIFTILTTVGVYKFCTA